MDNKDSTQQPRSGPGIPDLPADFDYEAYAKEKVEIITVTLVDCGRPCVVEYGVVKGRDGVKRAVRKDSK
ncbi:hypothetical protein NW754_014828 [Fusarium falciforme]|uniref:Uncharacterized protein n=1 Tax=Fusarium falciforme TaxID=195108 RepID=A0A9W8UZK0_9HYPO|nr:hypothetical protein NW754_014828 [Fusarium falciforme]KAJ4183656.1 hypothetical protein NW755_009690 [Fusarium falciforme]KAJ4201341.1 hypothetical protein NW767_006991 [Fusarium falciforme]KAJ4236783.1 hypothetical protein NW757_013397 [Fusarium falciforme]